MRNEFTAVVEQDGPWYIADSAEEPGTNGQGESREECLANLRQAITPILEHRREESFAIATSRRAPGTRCDRMSVIVGT